MVWKGGTSSMNVDSNAEKLRMSLRAWSPTSFETLKSTLWAVTSTGETRQKMSQCCIPSWVSSVL